MMFFDSRCTAERLAERLLTFSRGTSKQTGQAFYVVPASNCLGAHWTAIDGSGCTCLGFQQRGTCTHQLACLLEAQRAAAPCIEAAQQHRAEFGPCVTAGCIAAATGKSRRCDPCLAHVVDRLGI